jgi:hypothetical protein
VINPFLEMMKAEKNALQNGFYLTITSAFFIESNWWVNLQKTKKNKSKNNFDENGLVVFKKISKSTMGVATFKI